MPSLTPRAIVICVAWLSAAAANIYGDVPSAFFGAFMFSLIIWDD